MREIKKKMMELCDSGMAPGQRQKYFSAYMEGIRGSLTPEQAIEHAELTTKKRNNLKEKSFALPGSRSYPIHDMVHARNALARVAQHGTPEEKAKVKAAVHKKFPSLAGKDEMAESQDFAGKPLTSNNLSKLTVVPKGKRDAALEDKRHQELFNAHIKEINDKGATVKKLSVQDEGDCVYSDTDQGKLKSEMDNTSKVVHTWNP